MDERSVKDRAQRTSDQSLVVQHQRLCAQRVSRRPGRRQLVKTVATQPELLQNVVKRVLPLGQRNCVVISDCELVE